MARKEKVVQFNHKVPTVAWRQPELELNHDNECINCAALHRKDSAFCSYFCRIEYKAAA